MVNVEPQLALKLNWNILLLLEKKNNYKLVIASHCHILLYIYMVTPRNVDETHTHTLIQEHPSIFIKHSEDKVDEKESMETTQQANRQTHGRGNA